MSNLVTNPHLMPWLECFCMGVVSVSLVFKTVSFLDLDSSLIVVQNIMRKGY